MGGGHSCSDLWGTDRYIIQLPLLQQAPPAPSLGLPWLGPQRCLLITWEEPECMAVLSATMYSVHSLTQKHSLPGPTWDPGTANKPLSPQLQHSPRSQSSSKASWGLGKDLEDKMYHFRLRLGIMTWVTHRVTKRIKWVPACKALINVWLNK